MNKKILTLNLAAYMIFFAGIKTQAEETCLLRDGFIISGVDGKVVFEKTGDKWFFVFSSDASDEQGRVGAGSKLELLPSAALEKIEANIEKHPKDSFRLWARVTQYNGRNYLFVIYFLSITEVTPATGQQNAKISINEPNDPLALPEEVVAKLKNKKIIHPDELEKGVELKDDSILADRIGFIVKSEASREVFVLDALGRSCGRISLELLPCQILEQARVTKESELDKTRLKVAGIVTRYKGRYYLLLQRTSRVYSYGNFE